MKNFLTYILIFSLLTAHASEEGTLVVLNKADNTASILNAKTGEVLATLPTGVGPHEVAISPKGDIAVVGNYGNQTPGNSLTIIDLKALKVMKTLSLGEYERPHGLKFISKDKLVITAERQQAVVLFSLKEEKVLSTIPTNQQASHMVVTDAKRGLAYTANILPGTVSKLDLKRGELVMNFEVSKGIEGIGISPDGKEVWVANRQSNKVIVLNSDNGEIIKTMDSPTLPFRVEFSPNGKYAVIPNAVSGDISVFEAKTKTLLGSVKIEGFNWKGDTFNNPGPVGLIVGADSKNVFVNCQGLSKVVSFNLESLKIEDVFSVGNGPDGIGFSTVQH